MTIQSNIVTTIEQHNLISPHEKIIIAVSGGADSIALLEIMMEIIQPAFYIDIAIAHFEHGIRSESIQEAHFVAKIAKKYALPFYVSSENITAYSSQGIEERSRKMRYSFLQRCAYLFGANKIALAHHANDQAETLLFNLIRGSGVIGLSSIPYQRLLNKTVAIIRPLLDIEKIDIMQYLEQKEIAWMEDSSNQDIRYERNKIRHTLIPFIQEHFNPHIISSLNRTSQICQNITIYLEEEAKNILKKIVLHICQKEHLLKLLQAQNFYVFTISATKFFDLNSAIKPFILKEILRQINVSASIRENHYQMIEQLSATNTGKVILAKQICVEKKFDNIYVYQSFSSQTKPEKLFVGKSIRFNNLLFSFSNENNKPQKYNSNFVQYIDIAKITTPLTIRYWNLQDSFIPLGSKGQKKVAKTFANIKLYTPFRELIPIIVDDNNKVVWIPGICLSENCKITDKTTGFGKISISFP